MPGLQINSKSEFYALSRANQLGNRVAQWDWPEFRDRWTYQFTKYADERLPPIIGIRSAEAADVKVTGLYPVKKAMKLAIKHWPRSQHWLYDEALPVELITVLGEVMHDHHGLSMRYSHEQMHMRRLWDYDRSLPAGKSVVKHAFGMEAWSVLKTYMDTPSLECFQEILQVYERPIVEFSCCIRTVGVLRWNTVFWEVRTGY